MVSILTPRLIPSPSIYDKKDAEFSTPNPLSVVERSDLVELTTYYLRSLFLSGTDPSKSKPSLIPTFSKASCTTVSAKRKL